MPQRYLCIRFRMNSAVADVCWMNLASSSRWWSSSWVLWQDVSSWLGLTFCGIWRRISLKCRRVKGWSICLRSLDSIISNKNWNWRRLHGVAALLLNLSASTQMAQARAPWRCIRVLAFSLQRHAEPFLSALGKSSSFGRMFCCCRIAFSSCSRVAPHRVTVPPL